MSRETNILDWTPFEYENLTVTTSAISMLTEALRNDAGAIFLTLQNNSINYRIDGGDPTSILGHSILSGALQTLWLGNRAAIRNLKMIAVGGDSIAKITYYRRQY